MNIRGQYDANKAKEARRAQERQPTPLWWLGQRDPIARFTKWLVIWTAALVIATIATTIVLLLTDRTFDKQLTVMRGQLEEMKSQRLINIANTRANLVRGISVHSLTEGGVLANIGERVTGFNISPYWDNHGSSEAREFRAWFDIQSFDIGPIRPKQMSEKDCPSSTAPDPLPIGSIILNGGRAIQLAKFLPIADATAEMGNSASKYILLWGHAEYKDIYFPETPAHVHDWCVSAVPNDLRSGAFSFIGLIENVH